MHLALLVSMVGFGKRSEGALKKRKEGPGSKAPDPLQLLIPSKAGEPRKGNTHNADCITRKSERFFQIKAFKQKGQISPAPKAH